MVLSNKKLKQKLREEIAKKNADSISSNGPTTPTNPKTMKQLLDTVTTQKKPILSKREKRRINLPLLLKGKDVDTHVGEESGKGVKRKIDEVVGSEEVEGEVEENKKKKKKKKKEKKRKKDLGEGVVGEEGGGGGGVHEEGKMKSLGTNDSNNVVLRKKKNKKKMKHKKKKKGEKKVKEEEELVVVNGKGECVVEQVVPQISQGNGADPKKVYAGGMPYYSTEGDIRSYFDHCGTITDIDCIRFPESGKFRGIAMITFQTEEAAKSALELDGSEMGGLYLKIQPYKATRPTKTLDFTPPAIEGYNRIYAGNLSWDITEDDLRKLFFGCNISSIRFGEDKETGEFKGFAHVDFADDVSLNKALKLDQNNVCGRPVKISRAVQSKGGLKTSGTALTVAKPGNSSEANSVVTPENNSGANTIVAPENNIEVYPVAVIPENTSGVSSGKLRRRTCYECGERGHISSDCPKKQTTAEVTAG